MIIAPRRMLIVTYELKGAMAYTQFFEALKQQGAWSHHIAPTWLIVTDKTCLQVHEAVKPFLQPGDRILIATLQDGYWGWMPKEAWDWIRAQGLNP